MKLLKLLVLITISISFGSVPSVVRTDTIKGTNDTLEFVNYMSNGYDTIPIHFLPHTC